MHRATTTRRRRAETAIEHVRDSTVSTQATGGTTKLTFGVAPTTGNLLVVMIDGYHNLGPRHRTGGVSGGGCLDVDQSARFDQTSKCAPGPGKQIRGPPPEETAA